MNDSEIAALTAWGLRCADRFTLHDPAVSGEDLVQSAWEGAYARIAGIADATERKKFLAACVRNQALHVYRRRKRRPEISFHKPIATVVNGGEQRDLTLEGHLPAPGDLEADTASKFDLLTLIDQARAGDGVVACAILVAAFGQEHAMAHLGIPNGTASSRVARFRDRPREAA